MFIVAGFILVMNGLSRETALGTFCLHSKTRDAFGALSAFHPNQSPTEPIAHETTLSLQEEISISSTVPIALKSLVILLIDLKSYN